MLLMPILTNMDTSNKILNESIMRNLSFPDFEVKKMEFSSREKTLIIFVGGAWLDRNEGSELGKGILFFNDWESLSIRRFDPLKEKWSVDEFPIEQLRDICDFKFIDSTIYLCGFGKEKGQWIEWKIVNAKMHAEFEQNAK